MSYKENPKTRGSGIYCAIPQTGDCPHGCKDCFFQSGRSYLEPLAENLPNMPLKKDRVIRVNDGNDSNVDRGLVMESVAHFPMKFYNTSIPEDLEGFRDPVVLTINPGEMTDREFHCIDPIPKNLMFVRVRANTWNHLLRYEAITYYSRRKVPIVLTWMAYHDEKELVGRLNSRGMAARGDYTYRKRTTNQYWAIQTEAWLREMHTYRLNKWVYSCGKIEGERGDTHCRFCGNCLREYFATMERL